MRGPLLVMTAMACAALSLSGAAFCSKEARMQLSSDAFDDGATIPSRFTCDGDDVPPSLRWTDPPAGTKSFALIIDDPDAPRGTFHHWGIYDIPSSERQVSEGRKSREARNDFGRIGYAGPCPPRGHGPHRYRFRLLALDVARLPLTAGATVSMIGTAAQSHVLASAVLTGRYERH